MDRLGETTGSGGPPASAGTQPASMAADRRCAGRRRSGQAHPVTRQPLPRVRRALAGLAVAGVGFTIALFTAFCAAERRSAEEQFHLRADARLEAVRRELKERAAAVDMVRALYDASTTITREQFATFAGGLLAQGGGIKMLAWVARVPHELLADHQAVARREGLAQYTVRECDAEGRLVPALPREEHLPVYYVEPLAGNELLAGFDLASGPCLKEALAASRDTGTIMAIGPEGLPGRDPAGGNLTVVAPVYDQKGNQSADKGRGQGLKGFIVVEFGIAELVREAVGAASPVGIDIHVLDQTDPAHPRELHLHCCTPAGPGGSAGGSWKDGDREMWSHSMAMGLAGRLWLVKATPASAFADSYRTWMPSIILATGLATTVLAVLLLGLQWTAAQRTEAEVVLRTAELAAANRELADEVAQRRRAEEEAKALHQQIEFILGATRTGLDIIDSQFNLRYVDPQWAKGYGEPRGRKCYEYFMGRDEPCPGCGIPAALATKTITVTEEVLAKEGNRPVQVTTIPFQDARGEWLVAEVNVDIRDQKAKEAERARLVAALEQAAESIVITDLDGMIQYVNPAFEKVTGYARHEVLGRRPGMLAGGRHDRAFYKELWDTLVRGDVWKGHLINRRKNGELLEERTTISPVRDADGKVFCYVAVKRDVTEETRLRAELDQAQKLESVGRLAAGVAHEISTPAQFVGDNTRFLKDGFGDLLGLIGAYREAMEALRRGGTDEALLDRVESAERQADVEFLCQEVPRAIEQSLEGMDRVSAIVGAMKEFARPETHGEKVSVDVNRVVRNVVTIARNEWKYVADVGLDLQEDLPPVPGHPQALGQACLHLLVNAAKAVAEAVEGTGGRGTIAIRTRADGQDVEVRISDTGRGIPEEVRGRIFEPFFTTREVGEGTGQGLAITRSIVVDKHGGTIRFETETGMGTTFIIRLPGARLAVLA